METTQTNNKSGLKLKFAGLYLVSIALIVFIVSLLWPRSAPAGSISAANPLDNTSPETADLLTKVETLSTQYNKLKTLDQEYADRAMGTKDPNVLKNFSIPVTEAETVLNNNLDNLAKIARDASDAKHALRLQTFVESFRLVLADRSAMNAYKTAVLSSGGASYSQQAILKLQTDLETRNTRIAALENQLRILNGTAQPTTGTTVGQQNMDALKATIAAQEKRIATLVAANAALERDKNSADADGAKRNNENVTALRNQNIILEKKVADLTTDLRLALVDCNLTRADAAQIISNSKQRKALLADALGVLNNLSANGDATVKSKVAEKIARLNKVASTMHD